MGIKRTKWDKVFSDYIRYRDKWTCQKCERKYPINSAGLHCSHFFGRRYWSMRLEPTNAMALCFGCHNIVGSNPIEHKKLWESKFEKKERKKLLKIYSFPHIKKNQVATQEKYEELKEMLKEVKYNG